MSPQNDGFGPVQIAQSELFLISRLKWEKSFVKQIKFVETYNNCSEQIIYNCELKPKFITEKTKTNSVCYIYLKKALIIHEEKTKEIVAVSVVLYATKNLCIYMH